MLKVGQNVKAAVKLLRPPRHRAGADRRHHARSPTRCTPAQHGHGLDYLAESLPRPHPARAEGADRRRQGGAAASPSSPSRRPRRVVAEQRRGRSGACALALKPRLPFARVTRVYETMERPLVPVLAAMEAHGVRVDRAGAVAALRRLRPAHGGARGRDPRPRRRRRSTSARRSSSARCCSTRWASAAASKGKTGAYSTGADVLEELAAQGHDLPARVLDWRMLSKLKSTYTDTLQDAINPETGRVHTSYQIAGAATGRLASIDPNLQNIPVRTEEGRRIREAFVAEPGNVLLSLDYSQIELRILAHMADIAALKAGVPRRPRHPRDDRLGDVRRADRGHAGARPPPGQGDQLRGDLRHLGLRPRQQPAHPARGRQALHRHLLRALPRHPRVHEPHHRLRQGARPRRDAVRPPHPHPRDQRPRPARQPPRSARRSTPRSRARPPTSSAAR